MLLKQVPRACDPLLCIDIPVLSEISEQVRLLDGLVRYRFGDDAELMTAWASARNVVGPFRSRGEAAAGGGQTPDVVKPAA